MSDGNKWYVLRVISGKERKLKEYLDQHIKRLEWDTIVSQVLVPTEKVYKVKNGKKVIQEKNSLPGYILIEAAEGKLTPEMIQSITGITNVIDFLGKANPIPLRRNEVNRILGKMDEMNAEGETLNEPFIIGETVKIIDGPFNDFTGNVDEVFEDKKKVKVIVKIFGRKTPVELNFMQVEKVN
ncbi:MAG: transcription termination/antitermination factor NusG [Chitinophagales bacterium]|nr:transcription termination/antitermination factor NusG [Chitinophagales bacterium]HAE13965.1 transcription termination/antitermination factor NusG [Bacteroidota bacterium]MCB9020789.1 transcription termination/antitermination factor NusG [Chitinophagales bacterium]MCB9031292.1 transcription termination/antitermination factor NusG [Chitinophagales bacterium]HAE35141.1 transcription termination/antitermination factor NusG [Bacteroidota bacterium]